MYTHKLLHEPKKDSSAKNKPPLCSVSLTLRPPPLKTLTIPTVAAAGRPAAATPRRLLLAAAASTRRAGPAAEWPSSPCPRSSSPRVPACWARRPRTRRPARPQLSDTGKTRKKVFHENDTSKALINLLLTSRYD